jgi:hypothetical protein
MATLSKKEAQAAFVEKQQREMLEWRRKNKVKPQWGNDIYDACNYRDNNGGACFDDKDDNNGSACFNDKDDNNGSACFDDKDDNNGNDIAEDAANDTWEDDTASSAPCAMDTSSLTPCADERPEHALAAMASCDNPSKERLENALAAMASCNSPSNDLVQCRRDQGSAAALVFRLRKETLELERRAAESRALLEREELRLNAINAKLSFLTNNSETPAMPTVQTSLDDLLMVIPKQAPKSSPERKNLCTAIEVAKILHIASKGTSITKTRDDIRYMGTVGNTTLRQNPNGTFWNIADKVWTARHRENSTAWVGTTTEGNEVFLTLQKPPMLVKEPVRQKAAPKPKARNESMAVKGVRRTVG